MKSKLFLGLVLGGLGVTVMVAGCGDGGSDTGSGGAGAAGTGQQTGTGPGPSTGVSSPQGSGATGGMGGMGGMPSTDGNDTPETAEAIEIGAMATAGQLDPVGTDVDYYKFEGKAGQALLIFTIAKPDDNPFDPTYPDTVMTLFGADKAQIAQNDDPIPRASNDAELLTVLPKDGTYYLRIAECGVIFGEESCAPAADIAITDYQVAIAELDPAAAGNVKEVEPNDTALAANKVTYGPNPAGGYYLTIGWGDFAAQADVDVYSFTIPPDVTVNPEGRPTGNFGFFPSGSDGSGATNPAGVVTIVDPLNPAVAVASLDIGGSINPANPNDLGDLGVPLLLNKEYLLFVTHPAAAAGAHDFYFFTHNGGGSNPIELAEIANDTVVGAESIPMMPDGTAFRGFIDGDIISAVDVDNYGIVVDDASLKLSVTCAAARSGSGVRDFTFTLLNNGTPVANTTVVESLGEGALLDNIDVPPGATNLVLQISATGHDALVTSTFYRCGIHFTPAQP